MSPAQILFRNALQLDGRILRNIVPKDTEGNPMRVSDYVANLITKQKEIILQAQASQVARDENFIRKRTTENREINEFPINSYALVKYRNGPPNSILTKLECPMRIVTHIGSKYTLQNLVTDKCSDYHVTKLRKFCYDPEITDPRLIANRDYQPWDIDQISNHYT